MPRSRQPATESARFFVHEWMNIADFNAGWALQANEEIAAKRRRDALALRALAECIETGGAPPNIKLVLQ